LISSIDHLERRFAVGAFAGGAATQVVDDDLGAMLGEQQGMGAANAAAGAGDNDYLVVKTDIAHGTLLYWIGGKCRPVSTAARRRARAVRPVNGQA